MKRAVAAGRHIHIGEEKKKKMVRKEKRDKRKGKKSERTRLRIPSDFAFLPVMQVCSIAYNMEGVYVYVGTTHTTLVSPLSLSTLSLIYIEGKK